MENDSENEDSDDEKKQSDEWRFSVTRAFLYGHYYIVKPCGYILYEAPLYRAEGVRRTVEIWNEAFPSSHYTPREKPTYAWMDKGCAVWYFILKDVIQRPLWEYTKIVIDRWHGGNSHASTSTAVSQFCRQFCDVSKMTPHRIKYQLHYTGILDSNNKPLGDSEAQERCMHKVGQLRHATNNMSVEKQRFFLFWLSIDMNEMLTRKKFQETLPVPMPYEFH